MKKHHRLVSLASALLLALAALPCTALAAEAGDTEPAQGAPPPAALYPAEVRTSEENGMIRLEKVYYLSTRDDPSAIPTGDFASLHAAGRAEERSERDGRQGRATTTNPPTWA